MSDVIGDEYQSVGPLPGTVSETGEILTDIQCKRCSYNLHGLNMNGRCPECGSPIGLSVSGDLLRFADPQWAATVGRGLTIILWMILVAIIISFINVFLVRVLGATIPALLGFAASVVSFYGVWLMTEPDPSGIGEDPNLTARKVVRITLVVAIIGAGLGVFLQAGLTGLLGTIVGLLVFLTTLVGLAGEFAKFIFYEHLAKRIPDKMVAKRARFLRWAWVITMGIGVLAGALGGLASAASPGSNAVAGIFACLVLPVGLAFLVFGIITISMLIRLRRLVVEQARIAEQTWASATAPGGPTVY